MQTSATSCLNCTYSIPLGRCVGAIWAFTRFLGQKPKPPNVFLDIIRAYVSAGWGKVPVIFSVIRPKSGGTVPPLQKVGGTRKLRLWLRPYEIIAMKMVVFGPPFTVNSSWQHEEMSPRLVSARFRPRNNTSICLGKAKLNKTGAFNVSNLNTSVLLVPKYYKFTIFNS